MRFGIYIALSVGLLSSSCQDCPEGGTQSSVYCNGATLGDCAAGESICGGVCANTETDRDNCGACGTACGDGLVCSFGQCLAGCESGLVKCGDACVDLSNDEENCGSCAGSSDATCSADQTCNNGTCGCGFAELTCNGVCTDPQTDTTHCGAMTDCEGGNAGIQCLSNQACLAGVCASTLIYRGSLVPTTGRWTYNGQLGLAGANSACAENWPGSQICTYDKLMSASMKTPSELINAVDAAGATVTSWWIDDPNIGEGRCVNSADNAPWTYQTADQGHVGKYANLTAAAAGTVGAFTLGTLPSCNQTRNVACCSIVTAP